MHGSPSAAPSIAGIGSAKDPFQARCRSGGGQVQATPEPGDLSVGTLRYGSAAAWAAMKPPTGVRLPGGQYFYKTMAFVRAGTIVTVTVASQARSFAAIKVQGTPDSGFTAVTYNACPGAQDTAWPGGFLLRRKTGCVPLDVRVAGEPQTRHIVLSVYAGTCH